MTIKRVFSIVLVSLFLLLPVGSHAQQAQQIPVDTAVRMGVLPNGLTYIVRHNANPKHRANYYIAQKVGSILEEDSQQGLAHFLEHMAFNGTKNFPGKNLIHFLEGIGCKFGADLNAYTAFDETVYTIMDAPTQEQKVVDSCLLIMHDWSNNITLDGKEIDEERGVIHEEWRMRDNAFLRMFTKLLPVMLPDNKYAHRMPIGLMSVVDNFPHSVIRDYYKKWYRPDLQGIIVVGDINPDYVVAKLKEIFKDVPKPEHAAERYWVNVADNDKPLVGIATDPEATSTNLSIMYKYDPIPHELRGTIQGFVFNYMQSCIGQMIQTRFAEILQKPNAPFLQAGEDMGEYLNITKTKDALTFMAIAREGEALKAMKALTAEILRVRDYGFTKSEYDRARTNILKRYEDMYNERDKMRSGTLIDEYKDYFLNGGYIPGIAAEYEMMKALAPQIGVEVLNQTIKEFITDKNNAIMLMGPKKDGIKYPTETELLTAYEADMKQKVEAYKEEVSDTKLVDKIPGAGKIVSEKKNLKYGATELVLGNGVKVYLKNTDFKDDEIQMSSVKPGGMLLYGKGDYDNLKVLNSAMNLGGLGKFDAIALAKALTGRSADVSASIDMFSDALTGSTTKADFETMLQLVYLNFTALRADKDAYEAFKQRQIEALKNAEANPLSSLGDSVTKLAYGNNPYRQALKVQDFDKISYDRIIQIAHERFGNAYGMQFFFVGNIDIEKMKPIIAQWLGSLPSDAKSATVKLRHDLAPAMLPGQRTLEYKKDLDTPTAYVIDIFSGKIAYNHANSMAMDVLSGILDQAYIASIREKEGGAYSVSTYAALTEYPTGSGFIQVVFPTDPKRAADLNKYVYSELNEIATKGPNTSYLEKTKLNMRKVQDENLRKNGYWLGSMRNYFYKNQDWLTDFDKVYDSITPQYIQNMVQEFLKQNNKLLLIMRSTKDEVSDKK